MVLKEHVLSRLYINNAFLLQANSLYRSLFWRLIESIELLSVLLQCQNHQKDLRQRLITDTKLTEASDCCNNKGKINIATKTLKNYFFKLINISYLDQCLKHVSCLPNSPEISKSLLISEKMKSNKIIDKAINKKNSGNKEVVVSSTTENHYNGIFFFIYLKINYKFMIINYS